MKTHREKFLTIIELIAIDERLFLLSLLQTEYVDLDFAVFPCENRIVFTWGHLRLFQPETQIFIEVDNYNYMYRLEFLSCENAIELNRFVRCQIKFSLRAGEVWK